jgi:hypothetical protein
MRPEAVVMLAAFTAGCSATPVSPAAPPKVAKAAATSSPVVAEPAPPPAQPQLPTQLLLPHANSVSVVDVEGLRDLGLHASLKWLFDDVAAIDRDGCLDQLVKGTRRVILSADVLGGASVMAVEQDQPPDAVIACLARSIPDAEAVEVGHRAGLRFEVGRVASELFGTLVIGSEAGLRTLQGLPPFPPSSTPEPTVEEELRRGALGSFGEIDQGPPVDVQDVVARLSLEPDVLVTAVMVSQGSFALLGDTRAEVRRNEGAIDVFLDLEASPGRGALQPGGDPFAFEELFEQTRDDLVSNLSDKPGEEAIAALVSQVRLEPKGEGRVRLSLSIASPRVTAAMLELVARRKIAARQDTHLTLEVLPAATGN